MLFDKKLHLLPEVQIIETTLDQNEVDALATANWSADKPAEKSLEVDWDAPAPKATGLDWGEIETKPAAGLDWGELETKPATGGLDWGELETKPAAGLDWGELETKAADLDLEDNTVEENPVAEVDDKPQEPGKLIVTEHEYMRMKIRHVNMKIYIRFLIMRILHDLHNSADLIVKYKNELKFDTTLSNYFDYLRKGFAELSETSQMHINDIGVLVKSRCEEMYALNAFVELLPFHDSISSFTRFAESMFINQTRMLCHVSFSSPSLAESTEKLHYVDTLSKDLLSSWKSWNEKCIKFNQLQSDRVVSQVIVTGFMIQLITATLLKRNNQLWWMLGLCEQLFDLLLKGDRKALSHLVSDVLSQKEPVPHPDDLAHGEAPPEFYDEFGIALFDRNSHEAATAEILLHSLVLSHVSSALKLYLERITELMNVNPELDKSHGFVSQSVQKNLTVYIFILDVQVARQWNKLEMDVKCIPAYIMECNLKDLWSLLCRTANAKQTVRGIIHTKNIKKWDSATFLADGYDDPSDDVISDLVVTSSSPILSFSINPLDRKQVAYVTTKGVNEIDSSISKTYFTSQPNAKEIGSQEDLTQLLKDSAIPDSRHSRSNSNGHLNFREKSNGSLGRLLKRQFTSFKKTDNSVNDKGLRLRRSVPLVTTIEAHRSLNCFLAGLGDSTTPEISVKLFQFGTEHELVSYSAASEGRLTKCRFDPYGAKFGGSDSRGDLHIWKFDPSPASLRPCIHLQQCHHGAINDFCFMNSSSILATAGISTNNMNVAVWDTLLPNSRSRVTQFQVGEAGMTSLLHSPKHNLLIAGGKKGMVYVMDMRHNLQVVNTFQAHDAVVKSITFNETNNTLISGSTSGEIKVSFVN
jgi:WD40 repeat protein